MISDNDLYRLAVFLGAIAMLLIVFYHFLEINTKEGEQPDEKKAETLTASHRSNKAAISRQSGSVKR